MSTLREQYAQMRETAERERQAVELRHELQGVARQVDRISRRFEAGAAVLTSPHAERSVKLCRLTVELGEIDKALKALPSTQTLVYRAARNVARDLRHESLRLLLADPLIRAVAGADNDPYILAARFLHFTLKTPKTRKGDASKGIAADLLAGKGSIRRKVATGPVALRAMKTKSAEGRPKIAGVASSTSIDLSGDRFSVGCLRQMEREFKGATAYIGHGYDLKSDVLGRISQTKVTKRGDINLLSVTIDVADSPDALHVHKLIRDDKIRAGLSVGVFVGKQHPDPDDRSINVIESLRAAAEISVVALPANWQDAWVTAAS